MHINQKIVLSTLFASALFMSCGRRDSNRYPTTMQPQIGSELTTYFPMTSFGSGFPTADSSNGSETIYTYDADIGHIHHFDIDHMTLLDSYKVNSIENHFILPGKRGRFLLDISKEQIRIVKADGSEINNILSLVGNPVSASFLQEEGVYVIVDDQASIAVLSLTENGDVEGKFVGGSKFGASTAVVSGDLFAGGRLVFSLNNNALVTVDVKNTLSQKNWVYTVSEPLPQEILWLARSNLNPDWALAMSSTNTFSLDIAQAKILNASEPHSKLIGKFRGNEPHAYVKRADGQYYFVAMQADSSLKQEIFVRSVEGIQFSVFDAQDSQITILRVESSNNSARKIERIRLADDLVEFQQAFDNSTLLGISKKHLLVQYSYTFGLVRRITFENKNEVAEISGYNIPLIPDYSSPY